MSETDFVLTRAGYDDIQRELSEILTVKRPQVVERIREARQIGDLTENFDYDDAKRVQAMLETRVKELKAILSHATVVDAPQGNGAIGIGSCVIVKDLEDGAEDEYVIVGPAESSPAEGRISHESLVGGALMGRKTDEEVMVQTPGGIVRYRIVSIQ